MKNAELRGEWLVLTRFDGYQYWIELAALATWREMLGYDDPTEALEAILHVRDNGESEHDPVTGENVWTEPVQLLRLREQAREDEAAEAKSEGCGEAEVAERAERAAYDAVHQPVGGGECALDRCRREARAKLGVSDPARKCGTETRAKTAPVPERVPAQARAMRPAGGKAQALDVLADQADYLLQCTQGFLHGLTDHQTDPLETPPDPEPVPGPVPALATPVETLAKYQKEGAT